MSILNALKKLLPSFGRQDVREKLRLILSKLTDAVIPSFEAAKSLPSANFKSSYGKAFVAAFNRFLPSNLRGKPDIYYTMLARALENAKTLTDLLDDYTGRQMGSAIHIEGITYQKASVIRLIELLDFFTDYASRQLAFLVASETNLAFGQADSNPYTKAELAYLTAHLEGYFKSIELLYEAPKAIMAKVEKIPELLVDENESASVDALAGASADPLHLGIIPLFTWIFTYVGMRKVDYEIERFEKVKAERRVVELRLEAYRNISNPDARTQKIIENYERELTLLRQKISSMEVAA